MWGTRNSRPLLAALWPCRDAFVAAAAFSFFINLLMLASPLYMMQIYNRVLPSRSESTLIVLSGLVAAMMAAMARASLGPGRGGGQALRDFDTVRQFLSGAAIFSLFDAPWMPVTIAVVFLLHPVLGAIATLGAVVLFG